MSLISVSENPEKVDPLSAKYRGVVVGTDDPKGRGRVKIYIEGVLDPVGKAPEFVDDTLPTAMGFTTDKRGIGPDGKFFQKVKVRNFKKEDIESIPWAYPLSQVGTGFSKLSMSFNTPSVGHEVEVCFPFDNIYAPMYCGAWSDDRPVLAKIMSDKTWAQEMLEWKKAYSLVEGAWDPFNQYEGQRPPTKKYQSGEIDYDLAEEASDFLFGEDYPFASGFIDESGTFLKTNRAKGTIYFYHKPSGTRIYLDKNGSAEVDINRLDFSPRKPKDGDGVIVGQGNNLFNGGDFVSPNIFVNGQPVCIGGGLPPFAPYLDPTSEDPTRLRMNPHSNLWAGLDMFPMIPILGIDQPFHLAPGLIVYLEMVHDGTDQGDVVQCSMIVGRPWNTFPKIVERGSFHSDCPTYCPDDGAYVATRSFKMVAYGIAPSLRSNLPGFNIQDVVRVAFCTHSSLPSFFPIN